MNNNHSIPYCPSCDHRITEAEVNITEGVALCSECGLLSQLSDVSFLAVPAAETLKMTPKRAKISSDRDHIKIRMSLFVLLQLIGATFVMLFWNGITGLFLTLAVAAVSYNTIGYVPDWLPVPGLEDGKPVMNDQVMGTGMTVFFCLFLTPFVAIDIWMIINFWLILFGSTVVYIDRNKSNVSTGIFFLRYRKRFDPRKVKSIKRTLKKRNDNRTTYHIVMLVEGRKEIKFGSSLNASQQEWLVGAMKQILIQKRSSNSEIPSLHWLK